MTARRPSRLFAAAALFTLAFTGCAPEPKEPEFELVKGDGVFEFGDVSSGVKDVEIGDTVNIRLPQSLKDAHPGYAENEIIESYDARAINTSTVSGAGCTIELTVNWAAGEPAKTLSKGAFTVETFTGEPVNTVEVLLKESLGLMTLRTATGPTGTYDPVVSPDGKTVWVTGRCMEKDTRFDGFQLAGFPTIGQGENEDGQAIEVIDLMVMSDIGIRPDGKTQVEYAYTSGAFALYTLETGAWREF